MIPGEGRYPFVDLLKRSNRSPEAAWALLWEGVWNGRYANDTFAAVRRAAWNRFRPDTRGLAGLAGRETGRRPSQRRAGRIERRAAAPFPGNWYRLERPAREDDSLSRDERNRERVRMLLDRHGIVFRELLRREFPALGWAALFRTLRVMELAGETVAGLFFLDLPGPQFMSRESFRLLEGGLDAGKIHWMNAADPASLCGAGLEGLRNPLPSRMVGNHVVYRGTECVVVSRRHGGELEIRVPPDDPDLPRLFGFIEVMLSREFMSLSDVRVRAINGEPARSSAYRPVFESLFDVVDEPRGWVLYAKRRL